MARKCHGVVLWQLLFLTFVVVLVTMNDASTGFLVFFGCIFCFIACNWMGLLALDNLIENDARRGSQIEEEDIEQQQQSHSHSPPPPPPRARIGIATVSAQREPWQDVQLFSLAPRAQVARLSIRALPPATCINTDKDNDNNNDNHGNDDHGDGKRDESHECPICMEDFKDAELIQPFGVCVHEFHFSCVNSWLQTGNTTCPVCRKDLSIIIGS